MHHNENESKNVGIYCRRSVASEGRSRSLDEQKEYCFQACMDLGFNKDNIYYFVEEEGTKGNLWWEDPERNYPDPWRPELTNLVKNIKSKKINSVVLWRADRLARDISISTAIMNLFREYNVKLILGHWEVNLESADERYMCTMEAACSQKQRERISEDSRRDLRYKAEHGRVTRCVSSLGFKSSSEEKGGVTAIKEEFKLVRLIFDLYTKGKDGSGPLSCTEIAKYLMHEGISLRETSGRKPKSRSQSHIHPSRIKRILSDVVYIGKWKHAGKIYQNDRFLIPSTDSGNTLQTVISLEQFAKAQKKLAYESRKGSRSLSTNHLLTGFVTCGYCGGAMYVKYIYAKDKSVKKHTNKYYCSPNSIFGPVCPERTKQKNKKIKQIPRMRNITEELLNDWVLHELLPVLQTELIKFQHESGRNTDELILAKLKAQIEEITRVEDNELSESIGSLDKGQFARLAENLRRKREPLERKAQELEEQLDRTKIVLTDYKSKDIKDVDPLLLKHVLSQTIKWIAVLHEGIVVLTQWDTYIAATFNDPNRTNPRKSIEGINPPSVDAAIHCLQWFIHPQEFINGRRNYLNKNEDNILDTDILPGIQKDLAITKTNEIQVI